MGPQGLIPLPGVNGVVGADPKAVQGAAAQATASVWDGPQKNENSNEKDDIDAVMQKIIDDDQKKVKKRKRGKSLEEREKELAEEDEKEKEKAEGIKAGGEAK